MELTNYWWLLIWMFLFGGVSLAFIPKREELVLGKPRIRWGKLSALALALPYVLWAGFRTNVYGDTAQYRTTFLEMPTGLAQFRSYMATRSKGPGFVIFEYIFKTIFSDSVVAFFLVIALLQIVLLVFFFRKFSDDYWLSMFLFVASTDYLSWMHNGMRQFLAVTIIMACLPLISQRRYILMCLIVLFCSLIHSSALVFLPFIFV